MQSIIKFVVICSIFSEFQVSNAIQSLRHKGKHLHTPHDSHKLRLKALQANSSAEAKSSFLNCTSEVNFEGKLINDANNYCNQSDMTLNLNFFSVSLFGGKVDTAKLKASTEYFGILEVRSLKGMKGCYNIVNIHSQNDFLVCFEDEKKFLDFSQTLLRFMLCRRGYWPTPDIDCVMKPEATQISHSKFPEDIVKKLEDAKDIFNETEISNFMATGNPNVTLTPYQHQKNNIR